ncbi:MAG: tetratricopeptide repeat protein [bacterium]|nr:tetratricopeptide repeat protein [bacterium]
MKSLEGRLKNVCVNVLTAKTKIGSNDYQRAKQFASKACIIDEHNVEARHIKGFCHRNLEEFSEAVETYRQIIDIIPDSAVAHLYLADCLRNDGRKEEAVEYYLESIKLDTEGDIGKLARESLVTLKESI